MSAAKEFIINTMIEAVPERRSEILDLWEKYDPAVEMITDAREVTLNANKDRIALSVKTLKVFWLIGFAGWHAIEVYSPLVVLPAKTGRLIADILEEDTELPAIERSYKERRAAAQALIDDTESENEKWPPDIPRLDDSWTSNPQLDAARDLTMSAIAFTFFHELKHVIVDRDNCRPSDRREEECQCDIFAREFMTAKLAEYAEEKSLSYEVVLRRRSKGFSLAALILHEITPVLYHGGSNDYFSVESRLTTILRNTDLPEDDNFWVFTASLLCGVMRQRNERIDAMPLTPKALTEHLLNQMCSAQ